MSSLFAEPEFVKAAAPPEDAQARKDMIAAWHKRKSAIYQRMVGFGALPPRSGVKKAVGRGAGTGLDSGGGVDVGAGIRGRGSAAGHGRSHGRAFCAGAGGRRGQSQKPAPDIYLLAAERLGVRAAECVVVEDSNNGVEAAAAAAMKCVVTVSGYTREEDFSKAAIVQQAQN